MKLRAAVDAAWSAFVIGAFAIVFRHEIEPVIRQWRADIEARATQVREAARSEHARRGWIDYLREHGIEPTTHDLGMES